MTDDEIRNMPAGREMDALVAEKLGIKPTEVGYWLGPIERWPNGKEHFWPSSDIGDAWLVVEKMESEWFWFTLGNIVPGSDTIVYEAKFDGEHGESAYACEDTAPLAICRAALLAVNGG